MLRLFRNIRQKLIEQENVRKYFWYAIGEIFLVVIGILIALQVSNWNEDRIIRQSAEYHLSLLTQDLSEDKRLLLELKETFENDINRTDHLLNIMKGIEESSETIPEDIIRLLLEYNFKPRNSALDVLVNSGEIGVLDVRVQNLISQYYRSVDAVRERDAITNVFIQSKFEPHVYDNLTYLWGLGNGHPTLTAIYQDDTRGALSVDIDSFLSDKKLEALLVARYYQLQELIRIYDTTLQNLDDLHNYIIK